MLSYEGKFMYKVIDDFPNYEINEFGVVRNRDTKYVTTQRMNRSGYLYVQLSDGSKNHMCLVHRLVAKAFLPNPDNLPIVNHIDECCVHNSVDNLEWITYEGNSNHGTRNERIVHDRKIPILAFNDNGLTIYRFESRYDAARELGVSEHSIRVAMKTHNKCRGLFWRAFDVQLPEAEYAANIEWLDKTKIFKDEGQKNRIHTRRIAVIAKNELGETVYRFSTIADAAKALGVSGPAISNAIKNKTKCKSLRWQIDNKE